MAKIVHINTVYKSGSTGRIVMDIHNGLINEGHESIIAYRYFENKHEKRSKFLYAISGWFDCHAHNRFARITGLQGYFSILHTIKFIRYLNKLTPDIIHLHNIHGSFLNFKLLFNYLKESKARIFWTLHDCWAFTGWCPYYVKDRCYKWTKHCYQCPQFTGILDKLHILDTVKFNYKNKMNSFSAVNSLEIVTVSKWLEAEAKRSFLGNYRITTVFNGINVEVFKPTKSNIRNRFSILDNEFLIIGVANIWDERKGLEQFIKLSNIIDDNCKILLVGLNEMQKASLPHNIVGITKTESQHELAQLYSCADILINFSIEETFGLVVGEALACGTPSVVYNSSACTELIDESTGFVIEVGNLYDVLSAISTVKSKGKDAYSFACVERIRKLFSREKMLEKYNKLYFEGR